MIITNIKTLARNLVTAIIIIGAFAMASSAVAQTPLGSGIEFSRQMGLLHERISPAGTVDLGKGRPFPSRYLGLGYNYTFAADFSNLTAGDFTLPGGVAGGPAPPFDNVSYLSDGIRIDANTLGRSDSGPSAQYLEIRESIFPHQAHSGSAYSSSDPESGFPDAMFPDVSGSGIRSDSDDAYLNAEGHRGRYLTVVATFHKMDFPTDGSQSTNWLSAVIEDKNGATIRFMRNSGSNHAGPTILNGVPGSLSTESDYNAVLGVPQLITFDMKQDNIFSPGDGTDDARSVWMSTTQNRKVDSSVTYHGIIFSDVPPSASLRFSLPVNVSYPTSVLGYNYTFAADFSNLTAGDFTLPSGAAGTTNQAFDNVSYLSDGIRIDVNTLGFTTAPNGQFVTIRESIFPHQAHSGYLYNSTFQPDYASGFPEGMFPDVTNPTTGGTLSGYLDGNLRAEGHPGRYITVVATFHKMDFPTDGSQPTNFMALTLFPFGATSTNQFVKNVGNYTGPTILNGVPGSLSTQSDYNAILGVPQLITFDMKEERIYYASDGTDDLRDISFTMTRARKVDSSVTYHGIIFSDVPPSASLGFTLPVKIGSPSI